MAHRAPSKVEPWVLQFEFPSYADAKEFKQMLQEYAPLADKVVLRRKQVYSQQEDFQHWPQTIAMRERFQGRSFSKEDCGAAMHDAGWAGTRNSISSWFVKGTAAGVLTRLELGTYEFTRRPAGDLPCTSCKPEPLSCEAP
jgi:hypothetical protein